VTGVQTCALPIYLTPFSGEYYNSSQETEELEVPRAQRGASRQ
jgi:hypothetical protein